LLTEIKKEKKDFEVKEGDILIVDLGETKEKGIQGGERPVLVYSNNKNNKYSPSIEVITITSQMKALHLPINVVLETYETGLPVRSVAQVNQKEVISKEKIKYKIGELKSQYKRDKIVDAIMIQNPIIYESITRRIKRKYNNYNKSINTTFLQPSM